LWLKAFENAGGAHASADTHRYHSVSPIPTFQLAQNTGSQFRAGATKRMAQCDGATIDVDLLRIESECLDHRERLCRKRFVQLNHINLSQRQPREFQNLRNGEYWPNPHFLRWTTRSRVSNKARHRL